MSILRRLRAFRAVVLGVVVFRNSSGIRSSIVMVRLQGLPSKPVLTPDLVPKDIPAMITTRPLVVHS
jgi:hypothetical protein